MCTRLGGLVQKRGFKNDERASLDGIINSIRKAMPFRNINNLESYLGRKADSLYIRVAA